MVCLKANELSDGPLSKEDISNIASLPNLEKLEINSDGVNNEDANGDFARWFDEVFAEERAKSSKWLTMSA